MCTQENARKQILTSHMSKFLCSTLNIITVLGLNSVLDGTGNGVVDTQDRALDQFDFPGGITS